MGRLNDELRNGRTRYLSAPIPVSGRHGLRQRLRAQGCRRQGLPRFSGRHRGLRSWSLPPENDRGHLPPGRNLVHVSNLYYTEPQIELAELLVANSFGDKVFMCNSGAEANEAAIKLARISSAEGRYEIITLAGSFHGRTLATVAATGQPKFHKGFEPLPEGFRPCPFGDLAGPWKSMIDGLPVPFSANRFREKAGCGRWQKIICRE